MSDHDDPVGIRAGALIPISLTTDESQYAPGDTINVSIRVEMVDVFLMRDPPSHSLAVPTPIHLEVYSTFVRGTGNPGNLHTYGRWTTARNFFDPPLSGPLRRVFSDSGDWELPLRLRADATRHGYKLIFVASNREEGIDRHVIGAINIAGANPPFLPASSELQARPEQTRRSRKQRRQARKKKA